MAAALSVAAVVALRRSRRTWLPNVQYKRFWSESRQKMVRFRCVTHVIKLVKKLKGGIDEYLAHTPNKLLVSGPPQSYID